MSIIVLYIIYISLTIIKYYVLTCFDKNKITEAFRPKVEHCDLAVGALRLGSRGIEAVGHCDYKKGAQRMYLQTLRTQSHL